MSEHGRMGSDLSGTTTNFLVAIEKAKIVGAEISLRCVKSPGDAKGHRSSSPK